MPRRARLDAPGALHHIVVGGSSGAGSFATTAIGMISSPAKLFLEEMWIIDDPMGGSVKGPEGR